VAVRIREFCEGDLAAVLNIQSQAPQAAQWNAADYLTLAGDPFGLILVAEIEAATQPWVVGFSAFHRVLDEAELRNMAVAPSHQRQGLGRSLVGEGKRHLRELGVAKIYLEVRASNLPAQRLYQSAGFSFCARRPDYYQDPREDGLVLALISA